MSRLLTSMRSSLSMIAAARRTVTARFFGAGAPGRTAASTCGAANANTRAAAPIHFRVRIRCALLSLGTFMSEAQLGAEAHHARDTVQQRAALGKLIALDGPRLSVPFRVRLEEGLTLGGAEPVRRQGGAGGRIDRVDVVPVEDVQRPDVEVQGVPAKRDRLVQLGVDLERPRPVAAVQRAERLVRDGAQGKLVVDLGRRV